MCHVNSIKDAHLVEPSTEVRKHISSAVGDNDGLFNRGAFSRQTNLLAVEQHILEQSAMVRQPRCVNFKQRGVHLI